MEKNLGLRRGLMTLPLIDWVGWCPSKCFCWCPSKMQIIHYTTFTTGVHYITPIKKSRFLLNWSRVLKRKSNLKLMCLNGSKRRRVSQESKNPSILLVSEQDTTTPASIYMDFLFFYNYRVLNIHGTYKNSSSI